MKILKKLLNFTIIAVALFLLFAGNISASTVSVSAEKTRFGQGEEFLVDINLNTEGEAINALEGKIVYPDSLLEVKELKVGNSVINFWVEDPKDEDGSIILSGIVPGGVTVGKGLILSIVFQAEKSGTGRVGFEDFRILKNDGNGTLAQTKTTSLDFAIGSQISNIKVSDEPDAQAPESFKPYVANDPSIYDGQSFIVFSTQDKGSGVDHYEIREGRDGEFVSAVSPYLLKNQSLDKRIFVKAVDKAGNSRTMTFYPENYVPWYKQYAIFAIILLAIVLLFVFRNKWRSLLQK